MFRARKSWATLGAIALTGGVLLVSSPVAQAGAPPVGYANGFEQADDVASGTSSSDAMNNVSRVASGTDGIASADGDWHGTAAATASSDLRFTRYGGYSSTFPSGGYTTSADFYLDMSLSTGGNDVRFDWSSAVNTASGAHRRDFIFSVGTNGSGGFVMSASNNSPGWPANPARDPHTVTTTGWYTFEHVFRDDGGVLEVDMNVRDSAGSLLKSWTLSDPSDMIGTTVGGNRYGWLVVSGFSSLAMDNITRSGQAACSSVCYVDTVNGNDANGGASATEAKGTIQAGVDAVDVGGTVIVAPGTYAEGVSITKSVTLQGANSGTAGDDSRGPESVVTGDASMGLSVGADDVTIDGFTIEASANGLNSGIHVPNGTSGTDIRNNVITGNVIGIYANGTGAVITRNLFDANNEPGPSGGAGIYSESSNNLDVTHNVFSDHTANNPLLFAATGVPAHVDLEVKDNTFEDNEYGIFALGIDGGTFSGNSISTPNATALTLGGANDDVEVTENTISGSLRGVRVADFGYIAPGANTNIGVNRNAITGSSGYAVGNISGYAGALDAECNWFGAAAGPTGGSLSGDVDADPWLMTSNLAAPCPGGLASATVVVDPANPNGWGFFEETATGTGGFVNGPGTPPLGSGSAELTVDATGRELFGTLAYAGTRLDEIATLGYASYRQTPDSGLLALSLQLDMDYDDTNLSTAWQGRLVFEPYLTAGSSNVPGDTWSTWTPLQGNWWASGAPGNGVCPQSDPCTWQEVLTAFPDAAVRPGGAVQFKAGGPWTPGFTGNVDAFTIGLADGIGDIDETVFDFEPEYVSGCLASTDVPNERITMLSDCTTDATIEVPDGYTWDGDGYTIFAVDPSGSHFTGAVLRNGGTEMHVVDTTVDTTGLAEVCDAGDDRLRGILFEGASGTAIGNTIIVRQGSEGGVGAGNSGCQEGNGIEARNEPFDTSGTADLEVRIQDNVIVDYVKGGVVTNGSVAARIIGNAITGNGPVGVPSAAQNGIQVGFGATAIVRLNTVSGNVYTPKSFIACGVLLYEADGVRSSSNDLYANERNQCNFGKGGGTYNPIMP